MKQPADLFDPSLYREVRQPYLEAMTLPPWCYTSNDFFEREVDRIFLTLGTSRVERTSYPIRVTILVPGDVWRVGNHRSLALGSGQRVRQFLYSSRHPDSRGQRSLPRHDLPYHGWTFDHDGSLKGARGMDKTLNFELGEHGLTAVRLETWDGFMFLNFDDKAESLADHLGDITETFASYNFGDMACVRREGLRPRVQLENLHGNAMEDYHTAVVHKSSIGLQDTVCEIT